MTRKDAFEEGLADGQNVDILDIIPVGVLPHDYVFKPPQNLTSEERKIYEDAYNGIKPKPKDPPAQTEKEIYENEFKRVHSPDADDK